MRYNLFVAWTKNKTQSRTWKELPFANWHLLSHSILTVCKRLIWNRGFNSDLWTICIFEKIEDNQLNNRDKTLETKTVSELMSKDKQNESKMHGEKNHSFGWVEKHSMSETVVCGKMKWNFTHCVRLGSIQFGIFCSYCSVQLCDAHTHTQQCAAC